MVAAGAGCANAGAGAGSMNACGAGLAAGSCQFPKAAIAAWVDGEGPRVGSTENGEVAGCWGASENGEAAAVCTGWEAGAISNGAAEKSLAVAS